MENSTVDTFFKIRHKPSGLYFRPSASNYLKSNLSKNGKVYYRKPSLSYLGKSYYTGAKVLTTYGNNKFNKIVQFSVVEICAI